jgi:hypothetical protein
VLWIVGIVGGTVVLGALVGQEPKTTPNDTVRWCGEQAGIDPKAPVKTITPAQTRKLAACLERYMPSR